jgi:hypothetical protein
LETTVTVLVGGAPPRIRLDWIEEPNTGGDRLVNVAKDAGGHTAEERRAIGRALVRRRAPDRQPENGCEDAKPELAAGAAA